MLTEIQEYLHDIAQYEIPTEEQNQTWLAQGNIQQVIVSNLRLVVKIALRFEMRGLPLDDLIQEGTLGLIHAVHLFDASKGRFSAYAGGRIEADIRNALKQCYAVMGLSTWRVHRVAHLHLLWQRQHSEEDIQTASLPQIARLLDISEKEAQEILTDKLAMERIMTIQSLATPLHDDDEEKTLADVLEADETLQPEQVILDEGQGHIIWQWLSVLSKIERLVTIKRFGLENEEPWTQQAIADLLHIRLARERAIEERALMKLRRVAHLSTYRERSAA